MSLPVRHLLPLSSENRWSDLLAVLVEADPEAASAALGLDPPLGEPSVQREAQGSGRDRIDLLVRDAGALRAVVEAKLLSGLHSGQLRRYRTAFPDADRYVLVCPRRLPVYVPPGSGWVTVSWEELLEAFAASSDAWVARTAAAWLKHLDVAVPAVGPETRWNDLRPGEDFVIAMRARMSWVYGQLDPPPPIEHDLVGSAAGVSWVARMNVPAKAPGYWVRVEAEENLPVRDFPKYASPSAPAVQGPSVKVCLAQTGVRTSAGFSWEYLHEMWRLMDAARSDWVTAAARPPAAHDRAGRDRIVAAGAPPYLGIGFGDRQAKQSGECMFGARFQLPADVSLARVADELAGTAELMIEMAAIEPPATALP